MNASILPESNFEVNAFNLKFPIRVNSRKREPRRPWEIIDRITKMAAREPLYLR